VSDTTWQLRSSPVAPARETTVAELETMAQQGKLLPVYQVFHQSKTKGKWMPVTSFPRLASLMEIADVGIDGLPEDKPATTNAWQTAEIPFAPTPQTTQFKPRKYLGVSVMYVLNWLGVISCLFMVGVSALLLNPYGAAAFLAASLIFGFSLTSLQILVDIASDIKRTADRS
jgi:hypothetical protein